ncbi:MerR family regulatory protein [Bifidobacterium sp. DSM 109960]|uniref:MerR family regulatory protein n=1 Tax=Bifidobacterium erythrocebi TaxID=2675325 RepID=A0A7Y0EUC9_9BIFI|nr:helix-turn-helix domain-containing protein [Bifidobacterium sp. DSM 109960]NMM96599.1 MerR family regulatory protein [Bifidobacterium sp. DSM 109960]
MSAVLESQHVKGSGIVDKKNLHRAKKRSPNEGTTIRMGNRALVAADGEVVELSDKAFEAALNAAMGVMGRHRMITTGQAARLLDCSPRTVARILDSGRLPFTRNGESGRRMVDVVDVMDYQRQERERMQASLSAMRQAAQEIAMNDDDLSAYVAQFD